MSRLDSGIRRLLAQKHALEDAATRISRLSGCVMEFGLGNGRTYDHLREILPDRQIYVFDRQIAVHPDCEPPADRMFLGDLFETLPQAVSRLAGQAAMIHLDIGTGDKDASVTLVARAAPDLVRLLKTGGVVVSDQPVDHPSLAPLELPKGVKPGRIHMAVRL
ncbi:MAG: class I SAM-dependent methyltransferase [Alphaproteobacteria bacterium]|nr:class I SAM-dependent methyltransferase [Alphaproteobacteria bacterium]